MSISKAQIYNITLNILGVSNPLENANSSDNRAILLNNYYELARDYVLKDFDWNFASSFRQLALVESNELTSNFKFCYDYPNDCICARDIFEKDTQNFEKFSIASINDGQKVIFCDCINAILRYTKRVDREIYFNPEFSLALSYYLASLTASVITGSIQKGELAYQKYREILKRAKVLNAREGVDSVYDEETYLEARN